MCSHGYGSIPGSSVKMTFLKKTSLGSSALSVGLIYKLKQDCCSVAACEKPIQGSGFSLGLGVCQALVLICS